MLSVSIGGSRLATHKSSNRSMSPTICAVLAHCDRIEIAGRFPDLALRANFEEQLIKVVASSGLSVEISLGSDAHVPYQVAFEYVRLVVLVGEAGFTHIAAFSAGSSTSIALDLPVQEWGSEARREVGPVTGIPFARPERSLPHPFRWESANDFEFNDSMCSHIAARASLPIMELDERAYAQIAAAVASQPVSGAHASARARYRAWSRSRRRVWPGRPMRATGWRCWRGFRSGRRAPSLARPQRGHSRARPEDRSARKPVRRNSSHPRTRPEGPMDRSMHQSPQETAWWDTPARNT